MFPSRKGNGRRWMRISMPGEDGAPRAPTCHNRLQTPASGGLIERDTRMVAAVFFLLESCFTVGASRTMVKTQKPVSTARFRSS